MKTFVIDDIAVCYIDVFSVDKMQEEEIKYYVDWCKERFKNEFIESIVLQHEGDKVSIDCYILGKRSLTLNREPYGNK